MSRIVSVLLAALTLAACGSDDGVSVEGAWSRVSAPTQMQGVVYFDLTVPGDDMLVGVAVPASVASSAEIHEVVLVDGVAIDDMPPDLVDDEMESTMDEMSMDETEMSEGSHDMNDRVDGAVRMQEMPDGLALGAGETVSFRPGSYHVMLPELVEPLQVGDEFELTLDFADADAVTVTVSVAETEP